MQSNQNKLSHNLNSVYQIFLCCNTDANVFIATLKPKAKLQKTETKIVKSSEYKGLVLAELLVEGCMSCNLFCLSANNTTTRFIFGHLHPGDTSTNLYKGLRLVLRLLR